MARAYNRDHVLQKLVCGTSTALCILEATVEGITGAHADRYQFEVDWKLYKPDGSVLFAEDGYALGSGPAPKDSVFAIAYPTLFIILDKSDPPGNYRLEATVQDKVTKTRAVDSVPFEFSH